MLQEPKAHIYKTTHRMPASFHSDFKAVRLAQKVNFGA